MSDQIVISANGTHQALRRDLCDLIARYEGRDVSVHAALAVAAQLCGQLILMHDPEQHSIDDLMDVVHRNIVIGNQDALEQAQERLQ